MQKGGDIMEKNKFVEPVVRKGKSKVSVVVCKRAACSGGSTHSVAVYKAAQVVTLKKVS